MKTTNRIKICGCTYHYCKNALILWDNELNQFIYDSCNIQILKDKATEWVNIKQGQAKIMPVVSWDEMMKIAEEKAKKLDNI